MFLEKINFPDDLKKISDADMPVLAEEIRDFLVDNVMKTGGHLASNLGAVELTLAMHRVFSCPYDKFIFDVGHQAYIHKILTGRKNEFANLRRENGISGFTKRDESEYDAFGAGHSSTSISAALGFAKAARLKKSDSWTVAVVGDGAFTGGLIYEALNNVEKDLKLMVILNDNEMSISKNVGKMSKYISDIRSSKYYIKAKHDISDVLNSLPIVGKSAAGTVKKIKEAAKSLVVYDSNFFENMGLKYYGPVDGNNYAKVKFILEEAKRYGSSCIVHLTTKKGLGYIPAEENPTKYHSVSPRGVKKSKNQSFSAAFGKALTALAAHDEKICAVTAAMCEGTGLTPFAEKFPERFFDVGIAEEHAVTFCGALSAAGMTPVFAVYSSFLQRAYDNLIHDVELQGAHIVLGIDRAGLSCDDGLTHHGIYDTAFLSQISGATVLSPISSKSIGPMLAYAAKSDGIVAIRYPKGAEDEKLRDVFYKNEADYAKIGVKTAFDKDGSLAFCKYVFISCGRAAAEAVKAAEKLNAENSDSAGVILCEILSGKEFVADKIASLISKDAAVVFSEEGIRAGGAGMQLQSILSEKYGINIKVMAIDTVPDRADSVESFCKFCKIDCDSLISAAKEIK